MKKFLSTFLAVVILLSLCIPTNAALPENEIMPLWENIKTISNTINFNGSDSQFDSVITGDSGTTVVANVKIFKQTSSGAWSLIKTDSASSQSNILYFTTDFTAVSGAYYKAVLTVHVTKNDVVETVTKTTYKTCP